MVQRLVALGILDPNATPPETCGSGATSCSLWLASGASAPAWASTTPPSAS
jgi:hypothetical protein